MQGYETEATNEIATRPMTIGVSSRGKETRMSESTVRPKREYPAIPSQSMQQFQPVICERGSLGWPAHYPKESTTAESRAPKLT